MRSVCRLSRLLRFHLFCLMTLTVAFFLTIALLLHVPDGLDNYINSLSDGYIQNNDDDLQIAAAGPASAEIVKLFDHHPSGKPRAVIYFLTQSRRLGNLSESLASLDENFNNKFRYPIVIFYEASDTKFDEERVRNFTHSTVFFQKLTFQLPSFINTSLLPTPADGCAGRRPIGYRHMCRFHAYSVHRQPFLSDVEYALRLDDDSRLRAPIDYDIFEFMQRRGFNYGYAAESYEVPDCMRGLHEAVDRYVNDTRLVTQFYRDWPTHRTFFNNFELSSFALWRSPEYTKFITHIDRLGGIYYHRWGDAPIRTLALSLFVPLNQTHRFNDIKYQHLGVGFRETVADFA